MITLTIPGRPPTYRRARSNGARRYHDKATTLDRARIAAALVEPVLFVLPAVCDAPASPSVCGWKCADGLAAWADRLVEQEERIGMRTT